MDGSWIAALTDARNCGAGSWGDTALSVPSYPRIDWRQWSACRCNMLEETCANTRKTVCSWRNQSTHPLSGMVHVSCTMEPYGLKGSFRETLGASPRYRPRDIWFSMEIWVCCCSCGKKAATKDQFHATLQDAKAAGIIGGCWKINNAQIGKSKAQNCESMPKRECSKTIAIASGNALSGYFKLPPKQKNKHANRMQAKHHKHDNRCAHTENPHSWHTRELQSNSQDLGKTAVGEAGVERNAAKEKVDAP